MNTNNTQELFKLNRELRAISDCNRAIVHATDETALAGEVCRIMCDEVGYRMVWVGRVDHDEAKSVRPIAWYGNNSGYLASAKITWADTERGRGATGIAARTGKTDICQNFTGEPKASPWRAEALARGFRSSIAIPLFDDPGKVFAVFTLYAAEPDGFTPAEVRLLEELSANLAFGIGVIRTNQERIKIAAALKESEEALRRYASELETANKELESFSYSVSHDLRAPLRSMDGYSQALLEDYAGSLDEQGQQWLKNIRASSRHMGQLIDDILGLSRVVRAELKAEIVDLSNLATSLAENFRESEAERRVEFSIMPGLAATGDSNLLELVLQNLLGNAFKFTSGCPNARIEFFMSLNAGRKVYCVKDNGPGFDMKQAHRLFKPFQRLHSQQEFPGTGIGLATVQRIIHRHGGEVWVEAEPGKGATFYFTIEKNQTLPQV